MLNQWFLENPRAFISFIFGGKTQTCQFGHDDADLFLIYFDGDDDGEGGVTTA